jgi:hypothetical protein
MVPVYRGEGTRNGEVQMKVKFTIKHEDGKVVTEVLDRQGQQCSKVKQVTNALGREISDEETGPECDKVEEIVS